MSDKTPRRAVVIATRDGAKADRMRELRDKVSTPLSEVSQPRHEFELKLSDDGYTLTADLRLADAVGNAGIQGYSTGGVANNADRKQAFRPYLARGMGRDFGLYHQAFLDSSAYSKAWDKIVQGLVTGHWAVTPAVCKDPDAQAIADIQAAYVAEVLFGIDGGWTNHVREALYALIGGFAPFVRECDGFGQLRGLSFRYPSQVSKWLTNSQESRLLGISFFNGAHGAGSTYEVMAQDLLLYQHNAMGNNWEGISPMRTVFKYIMGHELFEQLELAAAEKYGTPVTFVERPTGVGADAADDDALAEVLDAMVATDNPVILLPNGYKVTIASPTGQVPDFEPVKRYLDEQIASVLTAEGALVGMNGMGSYSMAEIKDDQALRTLFYYAANLCEVLNGCGRRAYTGVVDHILAFCPDPELQTPAEGLLPKVTWSLSASQDDANVDQVMAAKTAGLLTWGESDEVWLREKLKLPALSKAPTTPEMP